MTEARDATTVMLLRDRPGGGLEVHLHRRPAEMSFGADAHVFPGGSMDAADAGTAVQAYCAPADLSRTASRMGLAAGGDGLTLCRALHVCAAREVFEESGVLLARRSDGTGYGVADAQALATSRRRLLDGATFAAELGTLDARLESDWLVYAAHFITPLGLPKRYDTRFFLARAPLEQDAAVHTAEAFDGGWWTPVEMLEMQARGEAVLMPPTRIMLTELGRHATVTDAITALGTRPVARILFDIRWITDGNADFDHLPTVEEMAALEASTS